MVGRTVANYQFLEKLGAGGMGEIYKAQDTTLHRFVAIKVLSTDNAGDPERRRRFLQEAQAASALNHPNIITIHAILSEGDSDFMVMEYVAGQTLVGIIPKGGLRVPLALQYALQIAGALEAAHAAGIVHRDLKPANIMVTPSGLVKVLDFGLAKLTDRGPLTHEGGDATQTLAEAPLTVQGSIIGTVSYMSPEQAQGKKIDTRSDVFSFGLLLYEMVTGTRGFDGENMLSTLSAILRDEARPIVELAPDVPPRLDQLIHRCLRKNPDDRWQSMQDLRAELAALKQESDSGQLYGLRTAAQQITPKAKPAAAAGVRTLTAALIVVWIAIVIGGAGAARWWWVKRHQPPPAPVAIAPVIPDPIVPAPPPVAAEPVVAALTNDNIIELVDARVATPVILNQIRSSKTNFDLSPTELIRLTKAKVPASVIEGMRDPNSIPASALSTISTPSNRTGSGSGSSNGSPNGTPTGSSGGNPNGGPTGTSSSSTVSSTASTTPAPVPPPVATNTAPAPAPATTHVPAKITVVTVPDGTPVKIALQADIPADAAEGLALHFVVSDDFRAAGNVVIAKGAIVTGVIADAGGKKKFLGMGGGKMAFSLGQVEAADGTKLKVRSTPGKDPNGEARRSVEVAGKKPPKDVAAVAGSDYIAYLDGEQTVSLKK